MGILRFAGGPWYEQSATKAVFGTREAEAERETLLIDSIIFVTFYILTCEAVCLLF